MKLSLQILLLFVFAGFLSAKAQRSLPYAQFNNNEFSEKKPSEREAYIQRYAERYHKSFKSFNTTKLGLMKYFEERLLQYGLPGELKSLAYMESALDLQATSWAGAKGPWQLMPNTARDLGLEVSPTNDERTDVVKSTKAAIDYLKRLYKMYNDWNLAVAAYNCGPGNVNYAIQRCGGTHNILILETYLPNETKEYVRRFEAATLAWTGIRTGDIKAFAPTVGNINTISIAESQSLEEERRLNAQGLASYVINAGFRLDVIADKLSVPQEKLRKLNKNFDEELSKNGYTKLKLPKEKITDFKFQSGKILAESLQRTSQEFE